MSITRHSRALRSLGIAGTSRLVRPPAILPEPDRRPDAGLTYIGKIAPYIAAAFSPDGATLYVNHDGSEVIAYSFPGLVAGATVATPFAVGGEIGSLACDSGGVLYWWENTNGAGTNLYSSTGGFDPIDSTVDEEFAIGLCWSSYDGRLYGFGRFDNVEGQVLSSWDPAGAGRLVHYAPPLCDDIDWFNSTVATPDGNIWFTTPIAATPAAWRIRQWSIPLATAFTTVQVIRDAVIPNADNHVYYYGDPSGAAPAAGYRLDADHARETAPIFDGFSPGQRAVTYPADLSFAVFERGGTGEVWMYQ